MRKTFGLQWPTDWLEGLLSDVSSASFYVLIPTRVFVRARKGRDGDVAGPFKIGWRLSQIDMPPDPVSGACFANIHWGLVGVA